MQFQQYHQSLIQFLWHPQVMAFEIENDICNLPSPPIPVKSIADSNAINRKNNLLVI